jgi:hypothetical protein
MDRDLYQQMLVALNFSDIKMLVNKNIILQQNGAKNNLPEGDKVFQAR